MPCESDMFDTPSMVLLRPSDWLPLFPSRFVEIGLLVKDLLVEIIRRFGVWVLFWHNSARSEGSARLWLETSIWYKLHPEDAL